MTVVRALTKGLYRMTESSILVVVIWLTVLLAALPLAVMMEDIIRSDVGASMIEDDLREGLDLGWLEEFHYRNGGLADALKPVRVTPALVFDNLELWLSGGWVTQSRGLAVAGGMFLAVWILMQGGVLALLVSSETGFSLRAFLAAGGTFFFRLLRVALITGAAYYGVYKIAYWLFPAIERWTLDITVERTVLGMHLAGAGVVMILMWCVHLVADFAKIAVVIEGRRSAVLAVLRSTRQLLKHPFQAMGLAGIMVALLALLQVLYFWVAPGIQGFHPMTLILVFGVGQLYLLARWGLRIARYGAEIELFRTWTSTSEATDSSID